MQTTSTELYNPTTNSWQAAAPLPQAPTTIFPQGAVLLVSGQVLELGDTADIYDPASNSWQPSALVPPLATPVMTGFSATTAVLLPNGRVLAAGSWFPAGGVGGAVYDPIMQSWTGTTRPPALSEPSGSNPLAALEGDYGSVTALQDGRVVADGGIVFGTPANSVSITALYDPTQNQLVRGRIASSRRLLRRERRARKRPGTGDGRQRFAGCRIDYGSQQRRSF
ncbi:MAG TPA: hypothetical protein VIH60_00600 [Steroidobacteraceae bacterium]